MCSILLAMGLFFLLIVCLCGRAIVTEPFTDIVNMYKEWCPTDCSQGVNKNGTSCCGHCKCHQQNCYEEGNCCLEELDSLVSARQSLNESIYMCVDPNYYTANKQFTEYYYNGYKMISRCNTSYPEPIVKDLCENPDVDKSLYSIIPITDQTFHYRNQFCAMCNNNANLIKITRWDIKHDCDKSTVLTYENIMYIIKEKACNLKFVPPGWTEGERCMTHPISKCNITGLWQEYDEMVDLACNSVLDPFNATYRNLFCYLCNTDKPIPQDEQYCLNFSVYIRPVHVANPPFLALLDLSVISRTFASEQLQCDIQSQFKDTKMGVCRDILCDQRRYRSFDGTCILKQDYQDPVCYTVFMNMTITKAKYIDMSSEDVGFILYEMIRHRTGVAKVEIFMPIPKHQADYVIFKTTMHIPPLVSNLFHNPDDEPYTIRFGLSVHLNAVTLNISPDSDKPEIEDFTNNVLLKRLETPPEDFQQYENVCDGKQRKIVDTLLECPFIKLDYTDLRMTISNGSLSFEDIDVKPLSRLKYREVNDGILICLSDYLKMYESVPVKARVPKESARFIDEISSKNLLSLVCVCMSIACLFVTIVAIAATPEFYSLPGLNTLNLCVCLLLAQTFYQFGSGQTSLPGWACAVIGGVCHFLWLCVMFSTQVCSVDMFIVFRKLKLMSYSAVGKRLLKRLVYVCTLSLLFVGVNTVYSVASSAGQDFGYGGIICYISSSSMQIVTFIIPSVLVVVINIILFINVMYKINKDSINTMNLKQERNFFKIYARLSTLTGFTWIIGFVLLLVKSDVLEYCFILLNASQGIFIMVAFVIKRRLWKCCQKKYIQTASR